MTFATLYGLNRCREMVEMHTEQAKSVIRNAFQETEFLCRLADELAGRKH